MRRHGGRHARSIPPSELGHFSSRFWFNIAQRKDLCIQPHPLVNEGYYNCGLKLLIFSDIHNDWKTLEKLLAIDADVYISAGDQVSWGKGLDRCGKILQSRGDRVYVLPGNHESAAQSRGDVRAFRAERFPRAAECSSGDGTSPGSAIPTRRRSTPPGNTPSRNSRNGSTASPASNPLVLICHAPPYGTALDQIRPGVHAGSTAVRDFIAKYAAGVLLLRPHSRGGRRRDRDREHPRVERRQKGVSVRIGLNPHDIGRVTARIPAPPRPGVCRAEVSLTLPPSARN